MEVIVMLFANDPLFLWVIAVLVFALYAQFKVSSSFRKWSQVASARGVTAEQVARSILDRAGLHDVPINRTPGELTDHYNPMNRSLNLSQSVYGNDSIAALGVAAHEAGHAIQHKKSYAPLVLRNGIYPLANIGTMLSYPLFILGMMLGGNQILIQIAIYLFTFATLFTLITLPVEFDASNKAKAILVQGGYLSRSEMQGVNAVLGAAAMTYVAAALSAVVNLLRMIFLSRSEE
jgi:Zn-dependent membrane protease YugP